MAGTLPLKQWEALTNGMYDWDDVRYMLGDARHYVRRVWAATRSQAKYRANQELAECFNDDATAMLSWFAPPDPPALPASESSCAVSLKQQHHCRTDVAHYDRQLHQHIQIGSWFVHLVWLLMPSGMPVSI